MNTSFDPSDSNDSSDEDYVPEKDPEIHLNDDDCDNESDDLEADDLTESSTNKRSKTKKGRNKKQKVEEETHEDVEVEPIKVSEEEKKKEDDDIWADFIKDTGFTSKGSTAEVAKVQAPKKSETKTHETIKVKETFNFAGEEVVVEKEVAKTLQNDNVAKVGVDTKPKGKSTSGLSGILSQLGKKSKLSTLEKSQLDWNSYKKEENLEDELKTFNKGKNGYLERQDFLTRTDLRSFEIEKNLRTIERSKRLT